MIAILAVMMLLLTVPCLAETEGENEISASSFSFIAPKTVIIPQNYYDESFQRILETNSVETEIDGM